MKKQHTVPTADQYDGTHCPACGEAYTMEGQGGVRPEEDIYYEMRCRSCGATWTETYTLTGYSDLTDEDGKEIEIPDPC
jgi:hypothetical protein